MRSLLYRSLHSLLLYFFHISFSPSYINIFDEQRIIAIVSARLKTRHTHIDSMEKKKSKMGTQNSLETIETGIFWRTGNFSIWISSIAHKKIKDKRKWSNIIRVYTFSILLHIERKRRRRRTTRRKLRVRSKTNFRHSRLIRIFIIGSLKRRHKNWSKESKINVTLITIYGKHEQ